MDYSNTYTSMKKLAQSAIIVALLILFPLTTLVKAQENSVQGFIISLNGEKVTLDLTKDQVSKGDLIKVVEAGEVIIHPVTGEKIQKNDVLVSNISITEVADSYSVGEAYPPESFEKLKVGMRVYLISESEADQSMIRKYIVVPPMNIVGGPKGQLGSYMSDLLTEELFKLERFRILDRETFDLQQFELGLKKDGRETKTTGVDYLIVGSAFPPDVVVKSTGVPLKGIVNAATGGQAAIVTNNLMSDLKVQELVALVKYTLKVIDVSTGEVIFICSEMAKAEGKSQVSLESGVLGGITLNGGATDFKNTVTGKASEIALTNASQYVADFFAGKIKVKNFEGTVIELKKDKKKDKWKDLSIMDVRMAPGGNQLAVVSGGSDNEIVKGHSFIITLPAQTVSSITGKKKITGVERVGLVTIQEVDFDASLASIQGVLPGQDIMNNIIYKGHLLHYSPLKMTFGGSLVGAWSDALFDLDLGLEYYPNLSGGAGINHRAWVGLRLNAGQKSERNSDGVLVGSPHIGGEIIVAMNPLKKSFDTQGLDPYFGLKYKIFKTELAGGGPEVFLGLGIGHFFMELGMGWGAHGDSEMMKSDYTGVKEITGWGFNRVGGNFGYRIDLNRIAI